ncbi:WD40 repeat domain-containing protein [Aliterella atlantica]|uniref:WD40 repeat-containing protein n=1 Tax=Aliterella atlantica CENA595 TaxID=1618023 RepID=A0A0D8ZLZ4_9CYAN|nr:NB-ARC domain-containing protein [Aliterella atlantica]KJH69843.1 WD40 repeat-containing protein [Aliterella atlantica CENA595]
MTVEEALELAQQVIEKSFNKIQVVVFRQAWVEQSYAQIAKSSGYDLGYIRDTGSKLWQQLSLALGEKVTKNNFQAVLKRAVQRNNSTIVANSNSPTPQIDWGEAIDASIFYGRSPELTTLSQWVISDRCRLITILGMGGIGKTALAVKLAEQVQANFDFLIWRSLRNAPTIENLLSELILFVSCQQAAEQSVSIDDRISSLIEYLRSSRCLLILDNAETILQSDEFGQYRPGCEGYGQLLRRIADERHQSCLIVTSREKPVGLAAREGATLPVRSHRLTGLQPAAGQSILQTKQIASSQLEYEQLNNLYAGNPLALKIAASTISSLFGGDIQAFLSQGTSVFGDIWDLLSQQFSRLSHLEKQVMSWLAISREWVRLEQLQADIIPKVLQRELLQAIEALKGRSLIETSSFGCTQQPAVMEYVTGLLVKQFSTEISSQQLHLLHSHALIKATSRDYIRQAQILLILRPVCTALLSTFKNRQTLQAHLNQILLKLQHQSTYQHGYVAGNLLNLYWQLQIDLSNACSKDKALCDFSALTIRQAYLAECSLHDLNFSGAAIDRCVFAETFGGITTVAFSPNGQILATSDTSGEIQIWQVEDGKQLASCKEHSHWAWQVVFSPDGKMLASVADDYLVKLWDVTTGNCLTTLTGHTYSVNAVAFSPDGRTLATSSQDTSIRLWDLTNLNSPPRLLLEHTQRVWAVAFSPDGGTIASSSEDLTIKLWDTTTGECYQTLTGHSKWVKTIAFSPDGQTLASGGYDWTIRMWNVLTSQCLQVIPAHSNVITALSFSNDGQWLASSSYDHNIKLWDVQTRQCKQTFIGHTNRVWSVAFSPDSQYLASGGDDHATKIWDIKTGQCNKTIQGHTNSVLSVSLSPSCHILASGHEDQCVRLWNPNTGECLQTIQAHTNRVWSVAFAPQSEILATGSADRTIKLWDYQTGQCLSTLQGHSSWVWCVAFSPDGLTLASASYDQTVKLWDLNTGKCIKTWQEHTASVTAVAFSPDGLYLASSSFDQSIKVWEVSSGECIFTLKAHTNSVWSVAFNFDGKQLASCSFDRTIRIWDVSTGECVQVLQGHTAPVTAIAYADKDKLLSGSFDRTIRVWDLSTGQCIQTLTGHTGLIYSLSSRQTPQGSMVISSSFDEVIKRWDLETGELLTMRSPRPYENMNITQIKGLTPAQISTLKALGAVETQFERISS